MQDPGLRAKLTPAYSMGCKRILLSNDYYPALTSDTASVVASGLARVEGGTLVAQDGTAREADAIVFATGFHAIDMPIARRVSGIGGRSLAEVWDGDMRALRGTTVRRLSQPLPDHRTEHRPRPHLDDPHHRVAVGVPRRLPHDAGRLGGAALDARPQAQEQWCAEVERRMGPTVWNTGGCVSWYLNAAGRNPTLWPGSSLRFRRATRRVDLAEYHVIPAGTG